MGCEKIPNTLCTALYHRAAFHHMVDLIFRDEMRYAGKNSQLGRELLQWQGQRFQLLLQAIQLMIPKTQKLRFLPQRFSERKIVCRNALHIVHIRERLCQPRGFFWVAAFLQGC